MRIGIGLPAAVPGADMTTLGRWAAESERAGFAAVGVIDRLVYANLDPLIALAVAAGRTERVDLVTTVLSIGWRNNSIWSPSRWPHSTWVSGGRLLAGLGWVAGRRTTSPAGFRRPGTPRAGSRRWPRCVKVWDAKLPGRRCCVAPTRAG
jgi:alkanesulfonate monooxygenase SsuD/methylene tetrahydromethanopterin reductase-like flavin-dependent oxidoreductase (luciferase family)